MPNATRAAVKAILNEGEDQAVVLREMAPRGGVSDRRIGWLDWVWPMSNSPWRNEVRSA